MGLGSGFHKKSDIMGLPLYRETLVVPSDLHADQPLKWRKSASSRLQLPSARLTS